MRFDEFMQESGVGVHPADVLPGLVVDVGAQPGWTLLNSAVGFRVWICRTDPCFDEFCANAVLTMHRVEAVLDAGEVFGMLVDQQVQGVPGCREVQRGLVAATEGPGVIGSLDMEIVHERGVIDGSSRSRIVTAGEETLIAQLTVTALRRSPMERDGVWLTVRTGVPPDRVREVSDVG
ncbi:hypothetical protein [Mycobacterium sp. AT1]|uniref:hypothetical protein n=1 Tax=Mycobacterium sp. AT1 TaxID=1961706 RepID=UPI001E340336|nr:hypothetical protein [Mycobacterium sp. AT1]